MSEADTPALPSSAIRLRQCAWLNWVGFAVTVGWVLLPLRSSSPFINLLSTPSSPKSFSASRPALVATKALYRPSSDPVISIGSPVGRLELFGSRFPFNLFRKSTVFCAIIINSTGDLPSDIYLSTYLGSRNLLSYSAWAIGVIEENNLSTSSCDILSLCKALSTEDLSCVILRDLFSSLVRWMEFWYSRLRSPTPPPPWLSFTRTVSTGVVSAVPPVDSVPTL